MSCQLRSSDDAREYYDENGPAKELLESRVYEADCAVVVVIQALSRGSEGPKSAGIGKEFDL